MNDRGAPVDRKELFGGHDAIDRRGNSSRFAYIRRRPVLLIALSSGFEAAQHKSPETAINRPLLSARSYLGGRSHCNPFGAIPGIDLAYDVAVPIALIWYWFTFFRDARRTLSHTPRQRTATDRQSR
jgi:hypothetical protein